MSTGVKRYDPINSDGTCGICVEEPDYGAYVEFADYDDLHAEAEALRSENGRLEAVIGAFKNGYSYERLRGERDSFQREGIRAMEELEAARGLLRHASSVLGSQGWEALTHEIDTFLFATPAPKVRAEQGERQVAPLYYAAPTVKAEMVPDDQAPSLPAAGSAVEEVEVVAWVTPEKDRAITALTEAAALPQQAQLECQCSMRQQPVAWRWMYNGEPDGPYAFNYPLPDDDVVRRGLTAERPRTVQPLYAAPIAQTERPAGVVLPPQRTDKSEHVKYRKGWNSCLSEVFRLNRAQTRQPEVHLNPADKLPPVDCPLLIEVMEGYLVPARRTGIIENKSADMEYRLVTGDTIQGRFRWTYP